MLPGADTLDGLECLAQIRACAGFPPALIQVGEYEVLLDDSTRFYENGKAAGVDVELQVFDEMQHVFQFMAGNAPEADDAIAKIAAFMRPHLGLS